MDKMKQNYIKEAVAILQGQPLRFVFRAADMLCMQFGSLIEKKVFFKNKQGRFSHRLETAGEYSLHIQCFYRLSCGCDIILAKSDLYEPSSAILGKPDFSWDSFHYDTMGNNRMDEIISAKLNDLEGFIVDTVKISSLGDITINFKNGFLLEGYISISNTDECWRFFKFNSTDSHLVITGKGIEEGE